MPLLSLLSDAELIARVPTIVEAERIARADVIEHLMEVERRRLYLEQGCSSLYVYCIERLGYSEDAALKRARVARLGLRLPQVLDQLRSGAIHLTGLFLLDRYLNEENAEALLTEASGRSRCELEKLIAVRFPRPDVPSRIDPLGTATLPLGIEVSEAATGPSPRPTCPRPGNLPTTAAAQASAGPRSRIEPLSADRYRVEFTASAALRLKIERARELLSHSVPSGELAALFECALDELIERELKRRVGAGKPRRLVRQRPHSRHVPVAIAKQVWERDENQCTFVDSTRRRCNERRFLTLEHRHPFALGGPDTVDNLCLLCKAHNAHNARRVFGEAFIASRLATREGRSARVDDVARDGTPEEGLPPDSDAFAKVRSALCHLGFRERTVATTLARLRGEHSALEVEPLLRAALSLLTPSPL